MINKYKDYTREQLVEEYLEMRLATFVDVCGVDRRWMPTDVSRDPIYWKSKDKDLHDMHYEIARRYHIDRYDCIWLENMVDRDNLYIMHYKFKPLVKKAIELLEKKEKEKMKTRLDFVSNSSSSSYIVAIMARCTDEDAARDIAEKVFGDEFGEVKDFFENKTVLTAVEVQYSDWYEKNSDWYETTQTRLTNLVPAGICVNDDELSMFFDKDGEVRADLDPIETIIKLSWHSDDGCYGENEEIVYDRRLMGKVNEKTLKFTKWIHDKAVELYGSQNAYYCEGSNRSAEELLAEYEENLAKGNKLYFTRFSYEGDAMCYGHIYIADIDDWKKSIGQRMIDESNNVKNAWFVDS